MQMKYLLQQNVCVVHQNFKQYEENNDNHKGHTDTGPYAGITI